jgi:hypothetical protein
MDADLEDGMDGVPMTVTPESKLVGDRDSLMRVPDEDKASARNRRPTHRKK